MWVGIKYKQKYLTINTLKSLLYISSWKECVCQSRIGNEIGDRERPSSCFLVKKCGFIRLRYKLNVCINENVHTYFLISDS